MFERFTDNARSVLVLAQEAARELKHNYIGTEHLLLGLAHGTESEGTYAGTVLEGLGISLQTVRGAVAEVITEGITESTDHIPFTPRSKKALELSLREAIGLGHNYVGTEHILLGLIREGEGVAAQVLARLGARLAPVRQQVLVVTNEVAEGKRHAAAGPAPAKPAKKPTLLEQFTRELGPKAAQDEQDPVILRERETERITQVLSRRLRNVPLLIGEPGVGKTTLVVGLAQAIEGGDVPPAFHGRTVRSLDLSALLSDQHHRGRFAELVTGLLAEVRKSEGLILFLDNALTVLHTQEGRTEALALFRPVLGCAGISVIGACTTSEYRRLEQAPGLDRLVQPITVSEPSPEEVLRILHAVRKRFEEHHDVVITDEALEAAASLSRDHIPDQPLPGAAIDLLDEASARVRVRSADSADRVRRSHESDLAEARRAKEAAIDEGNFESAVRLRELEKEHLRALRHLGLEAEQPGPTIDVTPTDVADALAIYSGFQPAAPGGKERQRPAAALGATVRMPPTEHDPYIWSMS